MRVRPRRPAVSGFASLVLQGAAIVALGVDWLPAVVGGAVVIGLTAGWASVILSACFQRVIREDQLGRVSSMTMLSDYTLLPLATPFFGWLAATTSVTTTAALFGAGMALAGLWGASRPAIRAVLRPSVRSGTMEA
jgi:hypothetical protein